MTPERKARLQEWRSQLEAADPKSKLGALEAAHRRAGLADGKGHEFGRDQEDELSGELLDLIHMMLHVGVMPPPEFLLTLVEDWRAYLAADQSGMRPAERASLLERHLIGDPVRNAGNYANRHAKASNRLQVVLSAHMSAASTIPRDRKHDLAWREKNMPKYKRVYEAALDRSGVDVESLKRANRRKRKDE